MIKVNNKDIFWSYLSSFFSLSTSFLILPLILKYLSTEEIGFNYILSTISGMIILFDFGFSVQFARNFSFLFSGSQELLKNGISNYNKSNSSINFKLIGTLILSSKYVYNKIALVAIFSMTTFGTIYIYIITNGFMGIKNILPLWILFIISMYFNIYFSYYQSILRGKGMIKELNQINVISRIAQLIFTSILIFCNFGLFGIIISNFLYPFLSRYLMHKLIFDENLNKNLKQFIITKKEVLNLTTIVWHNSKKIGTVFIGSFMINKIGFLIAGFYLNLKDIASYGLMEQIFGVVVSISTNYFNTQQPMFSYYRIQNKVDLLLKLFSKSLLVFYILYFLGTISILFLSSTLLKFIGSNLNLPLTLVLLFYSLVLLLEQNHSLYATFIASKNTVPFVLPSIVSGIFIALGTILWFNYINKNIIGLIVVPGIIQLCYNNWKWPLEVYKDLNINFALFYKNIFTNSKNIYEK